MARTAVVAGTATAVAGGVQRHQAEKAQASAESQQQMAEFQAQQAAPAAPAGDDTTAQLTQLADMKAKGLLDDSEFAAAKAKLLGI
jgi:membrane protease subunit (stomatin/prohibitin family)